MQYLVLLLVIIALLYIIVSLIIKYLATILFVIAVAGIVAFIIFLLKATIKHMYEYISECTSKYESEHMLEYNDCKDNVKLQADSSIYAAQLEALVELRDKSNNSIYDNNIQ